MSVSEIIENKTNGIINTAYNVYNTCIFIINKDWGY